MKIIHFAIIAFILVLTVGLIGLAVAQSPYIIAKVYMASDGDSLYVQSGGVANVTSGGKLNIASGATFTNSNITAGTSKASNMAILGATKNLDSLTLAYGKITSLLIGSTAITATGTEINKLAGVTAGTSKASSAAVLGATKNLDSLTTAYLKTTALLFGSRSLVLTKYRGKAAAESVSVNISDLDSDDMIFTNVTGRAIGDSVIVVRAAIPGTGAVKLHFSKVPGDTIDVSIQSWQD